MNWLDWYNGLAKPSWTPAPATIGLIWQILHPIIFVSFGLVFMVSNTKRDVALNKQPWALPLRPA